MQPDSIRRSIAYFYGIEADIPPYWIPCDGRPGTPNLAEFFLIGASEDVAKVPTAIIAGYRQSSRPYWRHTHALQDFVQILDSSPNGQLPDAFEYIYGTPPTTALWPILATQGAKMESGIIMIWSGPIANIPAGWQLCDGTNGTPDLRDRFVIGASQDLLGEPAASIAGVVGHTGGQPFHSHELDTGTDIDLQPGTGQYSIATDNAYNYPPCVALAYIMKL